MGQALRGASLAEALGWNRSKSSPPQAAFAGLVASTAWSIQFFLMKIFSYSLVVLLGLCIWLITLIALNGSFGFSAGTVEFSIFAFPIFGAALPLALWSFSTSKVGLGLFSIAFAPLLGWLNLLIFIYPYFLLTSARLDEGLPPCRQACPSFR